MNKIRYQTKSKMLKMLKTMKESVNSGYCKFKKDCQFQHPEVICSEDICLDKSCNKRHPKHYKKFAIGSCKFNDLCEFAHDKIQNF